MNKTAATFIMLAFAVTLNIAYAGPLGTNITVFDNNAGSGSGYGGSGALPREDNETEANPNTIQDQMWDLEAFFLKGNALSMVGGYNFSGGVLHSGILYTTGDIFIDVTGDATYGTPSIFDGSNQYGWDYAIQMDFSNKTYKVLGIDTFTSVVTVTDVNRSNPWKLTLNQSLPLIDTGSFIADPIRNGDYEGLTGWTGGNYHYTVSGFDLGFLGSDKDFTVHYTYMCGNDNLIGEGTTAVPEPGTLVLLGLGICGLAGFKRFSHKK